MTRVVIVGEIYNAGLEVGGGPMPGGPGGLPNYPSQGPGFPTNPIAPGGPGGQPPGGQHPSQGPGFPTNPIALPPGGQPVPPGQINPGPVPPQYANQAVVAVHLPGQDWQVKTYPMQPDQGQPAPTPQTGQQQAQPRR